MCDKPTVFVVDDDEQAENRSRHLVRSMGLPAEAFASGEEFPGILPTSGPGLFNHRSTHAGHERAGSTSPTERTALSLAGDRGDGLRAHAQHGREIQAGARTVLDRPYAEDDLCDASARPWPRTRRGAAKVVRRQQIHAALGNSPPWNGALELVVHGKPNKAIAKELHVSLRTVANRRAAILAKLHVNSTAELIRLTVEAQPYA